MRARLSTDVFYDVKDREEFKERLLDNIDVEHEVIGLEIASISNDACSVRLVPEGKRSREYSVSSQSLRSMYEDGVIELKSS